MATTITAYDHLTTITADGTLGDLGALTIKLALVTSAYTWDATDTQWSEVSANEVATAAGYTTGGETIAALALSQSTSTAKLDGTDVTWTALTKTFRFGVAYASGVLGAITNPLLFGILFDDSPADQSPAGVDYSVVWNASGILTLS